MSKFLAAFLASPTTMTGAAIGTILIFVAWVEPLLSDPQVPIELNRMLIGFVGVGLIVFGIVVPDKKDIPPGGSG